MNQPNTVKRPYKPLKQEINSEYREYMDKYLIIIQDKIERLQSKLDSV